MSATAFLGGRVVLHAGDCRAVIAGLGDASIDAVVTDPPYALVSIVKRFGGESAAPAKSEGATGVYRRASAGFMGQRWDTGETAFDAGFWAEVLRVLKPGWHLVAASGTRTYHRLACAIEDAGFQIRDMVSWLYGTGFPKSHDVAKAIDRAAGAERTVIATETVRDIRNGGGRTRAEGIHAAARSGPTYMDRAITAPATEEARRWAGWGTALKPACEPFVLARKPLVGTVAGNVLTHGVGALNIDGCRIEGGTRFTSSGGMACKANAVFGAFGRAETERMTTDIGRWPANVVHDGSIDVVAAFEAQAAGVSRFFYSAKADAEDRAGSKHPTVKPVDLMRWLCRLVTPPGGVVLDPFAGTGTTGESAFLEGFSAVLVEREAEYRADIARRMALIESGPAERRRARVRARGGTAAPGPLFDGAEGSGAGEASDADEERSEAAWAR